MVKELLTIQEASELSGKSIQTIRRAIKTRKLKAKRKKTPQGFVYSIVGESLYKAYGLSESASVEKDQGVIVDSPRIKIDSPIVDEETSVAQSKKNAPKKGKDKYITKDDFEGITRALEKMISQHSDERQNFLRLINTLNEKIFGLENQLKLLQAPKKRWYGFWKK